MTAYSTLPADPGIPAKRTARTELRLAPPALFAAWSTVLILGYVVLDVASFLFWIDPVPVKPWNPQAGLAVAFVYAGGLRYATPLFAAAWICEALFRHPSTPMLQAIAALAMTLAFTVTGLAVRRRTYAKGLTSVASVRDFLLIAAAGAALSSILYVGAYVLATPQTAFPALYSSVLHKGLGDFAGIIVVMPLVALLLLPRSDVMPAREPVWLDASVFLLTLAAVIALLFSVESPTSERLLYLLFVPLIVLAMRRGFAGAALGIATVQVAIVTSLWLAGRSVEDAAAYQMLMVVLGITTLVLGAVAGERRRAIAELARRSAELRAQQQALSDAMRVSAASETASTLAHEMSQPLSAIGTYAHAMLEMLRRGKSSPVELTGVMERIVAESARTRETVQRIRDFFRSGAARRETVDLAALVADAVDALRDRMRANGISLATDVQAGLPLLSADRVQLGIVLHNLVGNAADAVADAPPPRWIRISARERGTFVEVEIADGGPGIDPSVRDALFEPLATTKPAGMGLGLPISRTLILAHGGRLELASLHPTTFRFTLPTHGHVPQ
jgi:two-component system, LuxR family, sensor kinase FixL